MMNIFKVAAIQNKVNLIIGYTNLRNDKEYNSALVIDKMGNILSDYRKVHLVTGLENRFTPGSETGIVNMDGIQTGTAICKDLDFPGLYKELWQKRDFTFGNSCLGFYN